MSLKDEIDKLIQAEREKLKAQDQEAEEFYNRKRQRFTTMHAVLREIAEAIAPQYLSVKFMDDKVIIEVGKKGQKARLRETDFRWMIEPNFGFSEFEVGTLAHKPGFMVQETTYIRFPEYETIREELTFVRKRSG